MWWTVGLGITKLINNWYQGWQREEREKALALKTEEEEERLQGKRRGIEDIGWGWRKADILERGAETIKGIGESAGAMYWSGLREEQQSKVAEKIAKAIYRTEESTAMRRGLEEDVMSTEARLRTQALGVEDYTGQIINDILDIVGTGVSWHEQSKRLKHLESLFATKPKELPTFPGVKQIPSLSKYPEVTTYEDIPGLAYKYRDYEYKPRMW